MSQVITKASTQMFSRPADECYKSMDDVIAYLRRRESLTEEINIKKVEILPADERVDMVVNDERLLQFNDTSFRHICKLAKAPYYHYNTLPPEIAEQGLNYGLQKRVNNDNPVIANVCKNETRALYTPSYSRLPDLEVAEMVKEVAEPLGYKPAGQFAGTRGGMPQIDATKTGLYAGINDMFLFLANEEGGFEIEGEMYYHLLILWNSETTARKIGGLNTLYRFICGNHQIYGAKNTVIEEARHVGDNPRRVLENMEKCLIGYEKYRQIFQAQETAK